MSNRKLTDFTLDELVARLARYTEITRTADETGEYDKARSAEAAARLCDLEIHRRQKEAEARR